MKTTKPGKQRKRLYLDPVHKRYKRFTAPLSSELKSTHNTNAVPVKTDDVVRIMRGEYKGFEGKVSKINRKKYRIFVEGVTREKVDGGTTLVSIHPSKVMITKLKLDDKWRREIMNRKRMVEHELPEKKVEEKEETSLLEEKISK